MQQAKFDFIGTTILLHDCGWLFVSFPKQLAKEIREIFRFKEEGWGRMKVKIKIGNTEWQTSIWFDTKQDTYWFPVKSQIRKKENIQPNQELDVTVWI